jgi:hypothetical protein
VYPQQVVVLGVLSARFLAVTKVVMAVVVVVMPTVWALVLVLLDKVITVVKVLTLAAQLAEVVAVVRELLAVLLIHPQVLPVVAAQARPVP